VSDPDTIRAEIEATRLRTANAVDALAEKVSPSSIAHRQTEKVKSRVRSVRENLMGAAHDAKDALPHPHPGAAVGSAGSSVADAAGSAAQAAKGNALVVGAIAFGAGLLLSSLIPAASKERELASTVKEKAAPLVDAAKDAAKDAAQSLKEPAQDAAQHLKGTVTEAADAVKQEGQSAASDVKGTATSAASDVKGTATSAASDVRDQAASAKDDVAGTARNQ